MPFRGSAQEANLAGCINLILGDDFCCLHQGRRHRGGADIKRPQHSWGIAPEPVISMNDMRQGVSCHRVGQLGRGCHHVFEVRPATCNFDGGIKGCAIRLRFQQSGAQIPERSQCLTQRGSGIRDTRIGQPLRIPPDLANDPVMGLDHGIGDGRLPFHSADGKGRQAPVTRDVAQSVGKVALALAAQAGDPMWWYVDQNVR